jgi:hypothetical protein
MSLTMHEQAYVEEGEDWGKRELRIRIRDAEVSFPHILTYHQS